MNRVSFFARLMILAISLLLFAACSSRDIGKQAGLDETFRHDPSLVMGTLDNGFRYVLKKNGEPRNRVSMHLVIRAGAMHETDEQQGLAHYLEHMMFNGTQHFPPGELVKYFQSIGMAFGGDANAHTGFYETVYDVLLPMGDRENLEDGLRVMRDYADGALLLESEVQREKNVILAEKRDRDSADYRVFESTLSFELPDMLLSKRLPIGLEETIRQADRSILKDYYDRWYRPDRMILVLVGEFDPEPAQALIRQAFSSMQSRTPGPVEDPEPGDIRHTGVKPFYYYEQEIGKTSVSLEVLARVPMPEDSLAERKKKLVLSMANRIVQNRLDALVRESGSPATTANIAAGVFLRHVEYGSISADCNPENWAKVLALIEQTLRQALAFGFSEAELERVKQDMLTDMEQAVKTEATRDSSRISREIMVSLLNDRRIVSPQDNLDLFGPFVREVHRDDVHSALKDTWDKDHRLILVTGNADVSQEGGSAEATIKKAYLESLDVPVHKRVEEAPAVFPYLKEPETPGKILSQTIDEALGITVVTFENGVRLNLKKTDFDANQLKFKLIFGGGKAREPLDKPGLASLAMNLINESGFGAMDKETLARALAGTSTRYMFSVAEDSFSFSGQSTPEETALMFQLIRTQILDPGFDAAAYDRVMEQMKQNYREMEKTVSGMDDLKGEAFLAGNDPRFGLPPFKAYRNNTVDDVKRWVGHSLSHDGLELSLAGDMDMQAMIGHAALYLGSLPKGRTAYLPLSKDEGPLPSLPRGKDLTLSVETVIPKGLVKVVYPTDDFWNISQTRRLSVLGSVFSDRLRKTVREELGAAYSPYAYNRSSLAFPGYGTFQAVVTLAPEQADAVVATIKDIASDVALHGIDEDELRRAVDPILTSIRDMRRTNGYWLNSVLSGSGRYPEKLAWARTIEDDYASINAGDIQEMARKYLENNNAATLKILPE